ncbi:M20/M25/M40 family metallo-hydrolase [bacterium]|nr:M20/M25/M40 family metallo-hydrolase [candidate division CSSED10-310 bacterium]
MDKSQMKEKIKVYFRKNREVILKDVLALLKEMVAQKTVNVPSAKLGNFDYLTIRGEEWRVGDIVEREFRSWGMRYDVFSRMKGRPNVIGYVGRGEADAAKLFMACHMDIVPPGTGWNSDPFEMIEKDGVVYGRGVLDNKGPLVSAMMAARIMKQVIGDEGLQGELQIAGMSDEEAGDPDGIDYGVHYLMEEKLINPTFAIIPDIGENMQKIDVAEKGRMVVTVTAKGVQAHGSTPHLGVNAINKMAHFLVLLETYTLVHTPDPILGHCTVNVGEIHGGSAANSVPNECSVDIDIRIVPGQTPENVRSELKALSEKVADDFELALGNSSLPHAIDPDNVLVRSIQANARDFGLNPVPFGLGGGTFAKGMNQHGILAVAFGPGDDTAFHVANEYLPIDQLVTFAELTCLVTIDLVG